MSMLAKITLAMAVVAAASFAAGDSSSAFAQTPGNVVLPSPPVFFDLGIDVTQLPQNPADARRYFASQAPETQRVLLAACHNYLGHPADAAMPETIVFCKAVMSGLG
jgi:hypothetical protein